MEGFLCATLVLQKTFESSFFCASLLVNRLDAGSLLRRKILQGCVIRLWAAAERVNQCSIRLPAIERGDRGAVVWGKQSCIAIRAEIDFVTAIGIEIEGFYGGIATSAMCQAVR